LALFLLAADDIESVRRRRIFSVLWHRQHWRLGGSHGRMAASWAWRVGLAALGIVTYFFLFVPLSLRELRPFLGKDAKIRVRRARELMLAPYLTGGFSPSLRAR
jgi:hypothetical protein